MREFVELVLAELRGAWRFRWMAVAAAWLVCLGGWAFVVLMPDEFESEATVLIDTTSDIGKLLASMTVNPDVLSRVQMVQTAMLGRPQLEKVARDTDLYLRATTSAQMNSLIAGMRSRIIIKSDQQRGSNLYKITYRDPEPVMAQSVVTNLLNTFVEETLGANREGSQRAQEFLREQLTELEAELTAAEARLADFKRANVGRMPSELGDYFARLEGEMAALERTENAIRQAVRRQDTLRQQLAGEQPSLDSSSPQSEIDRRIAENQRRLEELQLRFTDMHPDVVAVEATLKQLRDQKQAQVDALLESGGMGVVSDNPVFQNIQIELAKINVELASMQEQKATQNRKIEELRGLVDVLPQIEAELARLNRDYDVTRSQYSSLLQRLEVAELSESAEQSEDVKFQIIDPPLVPIRPVAPNRPLLLGAVLLFGLVVGGGLSFLGNQLKPVFTDPKSLRQLTGLPVLGTVLAMESRERRRRQVAQVSAFGTAIITLCVVFVFVFLFHSSASQLLRSVT